MRWQRKMAEILGITWFGSAWTGAYFPCAKVLPGALHRLEPNSPIESRMERRTWN